MSRELVFKSLILPVVIDVVTAAVTIALILELVPVHSLKMVASTAIAASSLAYSLLLVRRTSRLSRAAAAISSVCRGGVKYSFVRDSVICAERLGASIKGACYSGQEDRVYCAEIRDPSPASDPKDFYCARFDGGEFEDRDGASVYRGQLRLLTDYGVYSGQGTAIVARLKGLDPSALKELCSGSARLPMEGEQGQLKPAPPAPRGFRLAQRAHLAHPLGSWAAVKPNGTGLPSTGPLAPPSERSSHRAGQPSLCWAELEYHNKNTIINVINVSAPKLRPANEQKRALHSRRGGAACR